MTTGASQVSQTGAGVTIAMLDSGITEVPGIQGRTQQGADFTFQGGADQYGHGTFVAGLIAGDGKHQDGSNTGIKGIAPGAKILSVKVADRDGRSSVGKVVDGLAWVINNKDRYNIKVVNLSLTVDEQSSYLDGPVNALVEAAWYSGIVVVASSGNDGQAVTRAPANDPLIITVGSTHDKNTATTSDDAVSSFTSRGATWDGFSKPELYAPGQHVQAVTPQGSYLYNAMTARQNLPIGYGQLSGTSMSAALVSGTAALLLEKYPNLTPDQVKGAFNAAAAATTGKTLWVPTVFSKVGSPAANQGVKPSIALAAAYADLIVKKPYDQVDWNATWTNATWTNATWTNATWTNATWTNATWTNNGWTASAKANATWTNATWTNATWTSYGSTS